MKKLNLGKFLGLLLSLTIVLIGIPSIRVVMAEETLVNGGFEQGTLSGFGNGVNVAPTIDTSIVHSGSYSVKCVANATNWLTTRLYYDAAVEQNTDYIFSLWVYLESVPATSGASTMGLGVTKPVDTPAAADNLVSSTASVTYDFGSIVYNNTVILDCIYPFYTPATTGEWHKFSVAFNSGAQETVRLSYSNRSAATVAYLDDWVLEEVLPPVPGELTNGDFEYDVEAEMVNDFGYGAEAVRSYISLSEDGGRNSSKALYYGTGGSSSWALRALYKTVAVEPDTDYIWSLWVKFSGTADYLAGIAVADGTGTRIASNIVSSYGPGGSISSELMGIFNPISAPAANEWLQYTVLFNSGTQTNVRLYFTQRNSTISSYHDDWALDTVTPGVVYNGDFEQGSLAGFSKPTTSFVTASINTDIVHGGTYSAKLATSNNGWLTGRYFNDVDVEQDTDYLWSLWVYFESVPENPEAALGGFGVTTTADVGITTSLDELTYDDGSVTLRNEMLLEWIIPVQNPATIGEWHKYDIAFNSGANSKVRLNYVNYNSETVSYLDDWSLQTQVSITKTAGAGGTIEGPDKVSTGANASYTIVPDEGYSIKDVKVNGTSVGAVSSYSFNDVTSEQTIEAFFMVIELESSVLTIEGGTIRKTLVNSTQTENPNDLDGQQGLRFRSRLVVDANDNTITIGASTYTVTGKGMLLALSSRLGETEMILANLDNSVIFGGPIINNWGIETEGSDKTELFTTYVYGIKLAQKDIMVTTRAYVVCENSNGEDVVFYSQPCERSVQSVYDAIVTAGDDGELGTDVKAWF